MLGVIRRIFQFLENRMFKLRLKGIVRVDLEYAAPVWSPSSKCSTVNIERVKRRGTKALPGLRGLTYEQRLRSLNLPSLRFGIYREDMIEVFKIMKWFYDAQCVAYLNITNETGRTSAHSLQLQKGRARLEQTKNSYCYRAIPVWNSLSQEVVDACSTNQFENRLDQLCSEKICKYDFHLNIFDEQGIAFKLMFL